MKVIRKVLGSMIVFLDLISRPRPMKRSEEDQKHVDERAAHLSLYQFHACPFCVKVRRRLHKLNVKIKLIDASIDANGQELLEGGGKRKVPCLKIEDSGLTRWLYESNDINAYLQKTFG